MKAIVYKERKWIFLGVLFACIYFISRLWNITVLPIFEDEAIYIRWAQIASNDASWRFISLTDGKQPLLVWLMIIPIRLFQDPLFAGRLVSVGAGFLSMIGIGALAFIVFKNKYTAFFASLLYIVSPFTLLYDRMALMDCLVATFFIWSLFFAVLLVRTLRLDVAFLLGFSLAGGILTKSSGFLSIYLLPTVLLLFKHIKKNKIYSLLRWVGLIIVAILISQLFYNILRLSPWFGIISQKNALFVYPFLEWVQHPFKFFGGNVKGLSNWLTGYMTISYVILLVISILLIRYSWREKLLLVCWFLIPFFGLALFGKVLYPRFILFMAMPLFVLCARSLEFLYQKLKHKQYFFWLIFLMLILYPAFVSTKVVFSVVTAPVPEADKGQYINGDPSGWGIREAVDYLTKQASTNKITVFTDGTFGLMPYALEIYLVNNPNIKLIGVWPPPENYTEEITNAIVESDAYYVANMRPIPVNWRVELLREWQKGNNKTKSLKLYKLLPSSVTGSASYDQP